MKLQTFVEQPRSQFTISHQSMILLFGSCFSENIGSRLIENKFIINKNPFGILYNPISISNVIYKIIGGEAFEENDFFFHNNLFHSFLHHGSFSRENLSDALSNANKVLSDTSIQLKKADVLLVTFGTAYLYREKNSGEVVSNCHKLPSNHFTRERVTVTKTVEVWCKLIALLLQMQPKLTIIFTVSPIRHFKDGAHANQLNKSILHLAINEIIEQYPQNCEYFSAYEIMIDQLRDYRFYMDDMLHPSELAQNYIWKRFRQTYFSDKTEQIITEWQKIHLALSHKPQNRASEAYQNFIHRTIKEIKAFEQTHPYISCSKEIQHLEKLITNIL